MAWTAFTLITLLLLFAPLESLFAFTLLGISLQVIIFIWTFLNTTLLFYIPVIWKHVDAPDVDKNKDTYLWAWSGAPRRSANGEAKRKLIKGETWCVRRFAGCVFDCCGAHAALSWACDDTRAGSFYNTTVNNVITGSDIWFQTAWCSAVTSFKATNAIPLLFARFRTEAICSRDKPITFKAYLDRYAAWNL